MIPPFNDAGCLPPGIHPATLLEIDVCFGRTSEIRRAEMESIRWMVALAARAGAQRIVLNGSFVTDIIEPNDVDCALLIARGFPADKAAAAELTDGLPFVEMIIVRQAEFDDYLSDTFGTDRMGVPKGVIEIV